MIIYAANPRELRVTQSCWTQDQHRSLNIVMLRVMQKKKKSYANTK